MGCNLPPNLFSRLTDNSLELELVLEEIERRLRGCWEDRRLFGIWAEYYVATQIKSRNPDWQVEIPPNLNRRSDVVCHIGNDQRRIEVKTGKWKTLTDGNLTLTYADASFSRFQMEKTDSFHFAVFLIHENYRRIMETLVFSREDLKEVSKRRGSDASEYFVSRVKSLDELEKWQNSLTPPEPVYILERNLVNKPEMFRDRWDKIKH